jgi:hypothetical protein
MAYTRGWKLALEPGRSVGSVTQNAPWLRVTLAEYFCFV